MCFFYSSYLDHSKHWTHLAQFKYSFMCLFIPPMIQACKHKLSNDNAGVLIMVIMSDF